MVRHLFSVALALSSTLYLTSSHAANPIVIKGSKFFDSVTKDQFFIKGIAYQPRTISTNADPLASPSECQRDFPRMKDLGLNTIRVYQVDAHQNHDECMRILEENGLYLLLDLAASTHHVIRSSPEYDTKLWNGVRTTVDAFKGYSNTLGFFAGNEVTFDTKTTAASAFVKALLRDTKSHIQATSARPIPVGYANNDDPEIRLQVQHYFNCGSEEERVDFYGINIYEWCGEDATYLTSGYADRTAEISSYSVPVFFSEYGCNLVTPRTFPEVKSIFGPDMTGTWSGGIVYEWSQELKYGLVQINPDNTIKTLPDYDNFKTALVNIRPTGTTMDAYNEQRPPAACPTITSTWEAGAILPPTPSSSVCECMMTTLSCTVSGLGASSENLGDLLNTVCGMTSCDDISSNTTTGIFGTYSFCSPSQKLSYMYNSYHAGVGQRSAGSCHFGGMATLSTVVSPDQEFVGAEQGISSEGYNESAILTDLNKDDLAVDLLNPSHALEQKTHKLKRLVQSPNSYFMDVKCPGCVQITTVFSHAQTVVMCSSCANVLAQPTGGITRLTEGCSFRRKQA
ncbi:1,3-beta-glucanosyltransferase gas1 [Podila humilis]|nr:1,3-beta-glucanosyltransferase gas1 [Podila humilis]